MSFSDIIEQAAGAFKGLMMRYVENGFKDDSLDLDLYTIDGAHKIEIKIYRKDKTTKKETRK